MTIFFVRILLISMKNTTNATSIRTGPVGPLLVRLALPVLAGLTFNLLYNIVDTWFIARIDTSDPWLVGSTGLVFPLFFIFLASSFGITGGVSSLVSRAIGSGRTDELDRTAESGGGLALAASAVILLGMYPFARPLLVLFGGSGKVLEYGLEYLLWLLPTVPFMLLSAVFTGILQGEGRTKQMMTSMMIGTVANIVLDPVLMFGCGMGIAGAGLATAIGNALTFAYLVAVFRFRKSAVAIHWKVRNVSAPVVGEILRVGLPQSALNYLASVSFIFYNRMMTDVAPVMLTSFTLYSRLEQVALIPLWAMSSALSTVAGQAAGAHDVKRMREASRRASFISLGVCGALLVGYVLSSPLTFRAFQSDPTVLETALFIAPWMAASTFVSVPIFMITTVMTTAGFAGRSLAFTAFRIYCVSVPLCAIGAYAIGKNIGSVMACILISSVIGLCVAFAVRARFFAGLSSGRLAIRFSRDDKVGNA